MVKGIRVLNLPVETDKSVIRLIDILKQDYSEFKYIIMPEEFRSKIIKSKDDSNIRMPITLLVHLDQDENPSHLEISLVKGLEIYSKETIMLDESSEDLESKFIRYFE